LGGKVNGGLITAKAEASIVYIFDHEAKTRVFYEEDLS